MRWLPIVVVTLLTDRRAHAESSSLGVPVSLDDESTWEASCNSVSGVMMLTQFWAVNPSLGPTDSFTIHGLWSENLDGTWRESCDSSRAYPNITNLLSSYGSDETLEHMTMHWKGLKTDEYLWGHEWAKHGTCVPTLTPDCYQNYRAGQEAVDYFNRAVAVFKTLPTYEWLAAAGIVPSDSESYSSDAIREALRTKHGVSATIGCKGGVLDSVWYYFHVDGSLKAGDFVAAEPTNGARGNCPDMVRYPPKKAFSYSELKLL